MKRLHCVAIMKRKKQDFWVLTVSRKRALIQCIFRLLQFKSSMHANTVPVVPRFKPARVRKRDGNIKNKYLNVTFLLLITEALTNCEDFALNLVKIWPTNTFSNEIHKAFRWKQTYLKKLFIYRVLFKMKEMFVIQYSCLLLLCDVNKVLQCVKQNLSMQPSNNASPKIAFILLLMDVYLKALMMRF